MIEDYAIWRQELLFTGDIVQDADTSIDAEEASRRCSRYLELLEMVEGDEDDAVFLSIIDSMVAEDDYEVYQASFRVAFGFPRDRVGALLFRALETGYLDRDPERVGDWLGQLTFLGVKSDAVRAFNERWAEAYPAFSAELLAFVEENEEEFGWLSDPTQFGVLRPGASSPAAVQRAEDEPAGRTEEPSGGAYGQLRRMSPDE